MRQSIRLLIPVAFCLSVNSCSDGGTQPDTTPATVMVTPPSSPTLASGTSMPLSASVATKGGSVLPAQAVTWTSGNTDIATVSSSGIVTGVHVGSAAVWASAGLLNSTPITITVTAGTASQLVIRTQPAGAASGIALTTQPVIEIRDAAGNLAAADAMTVTATLASGGGALSGATATSVNGVATFTAVAIAGTAGDRTIAFIAPGFNVAISTTFSLGAGPATHLVVRTDPAGAAVGVALVKQPAVAIVDDAGNVVTSSTAKVLATISPGQGTLTGDSTAAVAGVATFSNLTVTGATGSRTLTFVSPGLVSATSASFTIESGPPAQLRIRTQPAGAVSGQALTTQPVIEVVDAAGNLSTGSPLDVTAAVATGSGTLSGVTATTAGGVAIFTKLALTGASGQRTISFSATGVPPVTSATLSIGPGPAVQLAVRVQPGGAVSGRPLGSQPAIDALDAAGNLVTDYSGTVLATILTGSGLLTGSTAGMSGGTAFFQSLGVVGGGTFTLAFSSGSLQATTSSPFTVTSGTGGGGVGGNHLVVVVAPSDVSNGVPMSPQPVVEVRDATNALVTTPIVISFTTDAVSGSIANGSATTVGGRATFSGLTLSGPFGARNYTFSAAGMASTGIFRLVIN